MTSLDIFSINVQGMKNSVKQKEILHFCQVFRPSVLLLQETNINLSVDRPFFIQNYSLFSSNAIGNFSGLAIYIDNSFQVIFHKELIQARLQVLKFKFGENSAYILNCHMPHNNREALSLVGTLNSFIRQNVGENDFLLLGGDFNYVDNPYLDRETSTETRVTLSRRMGTVLSAFQMIDTFRFCHPTARSFTHVGYQSHRPRARLDRIYVNSFFTRFLTHSEIYPFVSDHSVVRSKFRLSQAFKSPL